MQEFRTAVLGCSMKLNQNNKCRQISPQFRGSAFRMGGAMKAIALTACFTTILGENYALTEIIPDKTLGTEPSVVTPQVNINGLPSDLVNGGATRGTNLFHSFSQFNIDNGQRVYFANPVGIDNILTRVTGGNPSNILGTLGVDGGANLFLLNPNGIIFGENARLDIAGSFFATTANSLVFNNGVEFSATKPEAPPLLTINVPLGLQYGTPQPAAIVNAGKLAVGQGQNLGLVAGTVVNTGQLSAPEGQIAIATSALKAIATVPSTGTSIDSASPLSELLLSAGGGQNLGLRVTGNGNVELVETGLPVAAGDIAITGGKGFASVLARTATLAASNNLTLVDSQLATTGNLNLLAQDTVRVRDSVANRFSGQAGGNLYVRGDRGIDILALNHPGNALESGGNLSLVSDGIISGDAHFASGGSFELLDLLGNPGNFVSLYDPIISSVGDVVLGNYTGVSLKVESMGSITAGNITITGPDTTLIYDSDSDPDIEILKSEPSLILRAGVSELKNAPSVPQLVNGTTIRVSGNLSSPGGITVGNISTAGESSVNFSDFSDISSLTLNNNAQQAGNVLRLTPNQDFNLGSAFLTTPFVISDNTSFESQFQFRLHADDNNPSQLADGFVFIIQNDLRRASALGEAGGNLGYSALSDISNSVLPSLAVEFDIYENLEYSDLNDNHVALLRDGSVNHAELGLPVESSPFKLDNGNSHTAWIDYNGRTNEIQVFLSENSTKPDQPLLSDQIDLSSVVGSQAFVGFSAATGGSISDHDIENWQFTITNQDTAGLGGRVILSAAGDIQTSSITSRGGNIDLESGGTIDSTRGSLDSFSVNNGGAISLIAEGDIQAGNIISSGGEAGGNVNLTARTVSLANGARVETGTFSGSGGNLTVMASELIELVGTSNNGQTSSINSGGGNIDFKSGGTIDTTTGNLDSFSVNNGGAISLIAEGDIKTGDIRSSGDEAGGEITLQSGGGIFMDGNRIIRSDTFGSSRGGNINITAQSVLFTNGARVLTGTLSDGVGGNLKVTADVVELVGTSADNQVNSLLSTANGGNQPAGNLTIHSRRLILRDGAGIGVATAGAGKGGDLTVNASESVELIGTSAIGFPSGFSADTTGEGNAGNLTINTRRFVVLDGAAASVSTFGEGRGGNLTVNASESVELSGTSSNGFASGLYAQAFSDGDAGNLTINTQDLIVRDGAKITVAADTAADTRVPNPPSFDLGAVIVTFDPDATGTAGDIEVKASSILLDNQGKIIAQTDSTEGGNITLQVQELLLMRHNSQISATAGTAQAGGNGGNITINAPLIVAVPTENSDITANAFLGNGGNVQISTQGIFGLKFRPRLTLRSDITASSELGVDGIVNINRPDIDPARGLANLPTQTAPPEVSPVCQPGASQAPVEFVSTGRGGKPSSPSDPLNSNTGWVDSRAIALPAENPSNSAIASQISESQQIVEAKGWVVHPDGQIELVAEMPTLTAYTSWFTPVSCNQGME